MINKNHLRFFVLFLFSIGIASCSSEDDDQVNIDVRDEVKISLPLQIEQNTVFVSTGRSNSLTSDDMDMLGVLIESAPLGQSNYSSYASGIFTTIPDS
ncbi:MAG: hypothetical protein AAFN93_28765, partial [Bacteroidota bacterium]